jgi:hypothetical protein
MLRACLLFALATLGLGACNGDDGGDDGGDDAPGGGGCPIDPSFDNASCGDEINFTGELVDWDNDTAFCGVFDALFQVQGDGAMDTTGPNGRFALCVPDQAVTLLDVTPAAANSPCTTPASPYPLPGIAVAHRDVIRSGAFFSVRTFTAARRDSFFTQAGFSFAPALAQVLVHVHGTPRAVSIAAAHSPVHAVADRAWAPGDTGHEVFFPNVDPGGGSTMLSVAGGATGTGPIPLVAGTFTYVTVCAR